MPSTDAMKALLASAFPDGHVEVSDLTGTQERRASNSTVWFTLPWVS